MNRLRKIMGSYDNREVSFNDMYEGPLPPVYGEIVYDPRYWREGVLYEPMRTHRLTPDLPCFRISVPFEQLGIPEGADETAASDFALRSFNAQVDALNAGIYNRKRPDVENGAFYAFKPGNEVLKRNAAYVSDVEGARCVTLLLLIQLPKGQFKKRARMVGGMMPKAVDLFVEQFDRVALAQALALYEKQKELYEALAQSGLCAFVADGSILPRGRGGVSPLENAVPFSSPEENRVTLCGVRGMGIKKGVTVVTGGGYSGKSTLLEALCACVYPHVGGDGRELVVTDQTAVKIAAEDGRPVSDIDVSPFIRFIPGGDPAHFSTAHASGSTSQAANIVEAVGAGASLLLIDEDKTATNFMIRDEIMRALIKNDPIVPFTDRVRELAARGVSTVLVIGGSGEYLSVADDVLMMEEFVPRSMAGAPVAARRAEREKPAETWGAAQSLRGEDFTPYPPGSGTERLETMGRDFLRFGGDFIDARHLYQLTSEAQLRAAAFLLRAAANGRAEAVFDARAKLCELLEEAARAPLDELHSTFFQGGRWLELPRKNELLALLNRIPIRRDCE